MKTKVFIIWGGELSRGLGQAVEAFLKGALQHVRPFFSPEDIDGGAPWVNRLLGELDSTSVGIICITPESMSSPWVLFEAGAIAKNSGPGEPSRLHPLLFGVDKTDLILPLSLYQATTFGREEFNRLISDINDAASMDMRLDPITLQQAFSKYWPDLESSVAEVMCGAEVLAQAPRRNSHSILEEILSLSRMTADLIRSGQMRNFPISAMDRFIKYLDPFRPNPHDIPLTRTSWDNAKGSAQKILEFQRAVPGFHPISSPNNQFKFWYKLVRTIGSFAPWALEVGEKMFIALSSRDSDTLSRTKAHCQDLLAVNFKDQLDSSTHLEWDKLGSMDFEKFALIVPIIAQYSLSIESDDWPDPSLSLL